MTYPWVPAPDHWPRVSPIKAIVIHMAEGGGTVSWLTRPDGNSSHYVVEYDGRVIQMVRESEAAGSINPREVRVTDDPAYIYLGETIVYGRTEARGALGVYWSNPNATVIAIETEGFAKDGPNDKQRAALEALVADIRTRHPGIAVLGHRDFQSYKPCPGAKIPWIDYGGHGAPKEDDVAGPEVRDIEAFTGTVTVDGAGHSAIRANDGTLAALPAGTVKDAVAKAKFVPPWPDHPSGVAYLVGSEPAWLLAEDVTVAPIGDCTDELEAAAQMVEQDAAVTATKIRGLV